SSPEALVTVTGTSAVVHPPAGTRPRGATEEEDVRLAEGLLADPKERAEHVMLVDLARNDLGRVCVPGTVEVPDFMRIEHYSHVMHLVSTVAGEVDPERDALDVLDATFPAGTVRGHGGLRRRQRRHGHGHRDPDGGAAPGPRLRAGRRRHRRRQRRGH